MKENRIKYDSNFDELHIIFGDREDNSQVIILDNNVMVELDDNDDIVDIILPHFSKMLKTQINPYENFSLISASFEEDSITINLDWSGPPINITLSI